MSFNDSPDSGGSLPSPVRGRTHSLIPLGLCRDVGARRGLRGCRRPKTTPTLDDCPYATLLGEPRARGSEGEPVPTRIVSRYFHSTSPNKKRIYGRPFVFCSPSSPRRGRISSTLETRDGPGARAVSGGARRAFGGAGGSEDLLPSWRSECRPGTAARPARSLRRTSIDPLPARPFPSRPPRPVPGDDSPGVGPGGTRASCTTPTSSRGWTVSPTQGRDPGLGPGEGVRGWLGLRRPSAIGHQIISTAREWFRRRRRRRRSPGPPRPAPHLGAAPDCSGCGGTLTQ